MTLQDAILESRGPPVCQVPTHPTPPPTAATPPTASKAAGVFRCPPTPPPHPAWGGSRPGKILPYRVMHDPPPLPYVGGGRYVEAPEHLWPPCRRAAARAPRAIWGSWRT